MYTIEEARKRANITQEEMAKKLNLTKNSYINKEKGITRFYADEATAFSDIVGISFFDIIFLNQPCHKNGTEKKGE